MRLGPRDGSVDERAATLLGRPGHERAHDLHNHGSAAGCAARQRRVAEARVDVVDHNEGTAVRGSVRNFAAGEEDEQLGDEVAARVSSEKSVFCGSGVGDEKEC